MIERGVYKVVQHLNISHSLLSQAETEPDDHDMHKVLLERDLKHSIVYFTGQINFGTGTEIELLCDINNLRRRLSGYQKDA